VCGCSSARNFLHRQAKRAVINYLPAFITIIARGRSINLQPPRRHRRLMRNEKCERTSERAQESKRRVRVHAPLMIGLLSRSMLVIIYERLLCAPMTPPTPPTLHTLVAKPEQQQRSYPRQRRRIVYVRERFACKHDAKEQ
jgi:transposase InsO family protein